MDEPDITEPTINECLIWLQWIEAISDPTLEGEHIINYLKNLVKDLGEAR